MIILDNTNALFGDDLKAELVGGSKLRIAASYFSIYAYEALKDEFSKLESLSFIFTQPAFGAAKVTDKMKREKREFFIPQYGGKDDVCGSEFEIQLRNRLTQRAIARECAQWIRSKARFKSNNSDAPMQQFGCVDKAEDSVAYMPLSGFTAVDLGYQKGNAVSNIVNKFDDTGHVQTYLNLFDQIWSDPARLDDVTEVICQHIEAVYQENSPERIYFLMLFNIFHGFLEEVNEDVLPNDLTGYQDSLGSGPIKFLALGLEV